MVKNIALGKGAEVIGIDKVSRRDRRKRNNGETGEEKVWEKQKGLGGAGELRRS